jgi:hypothetical protein
MQELGIGYRIKTIFETAKDHKVQHEGTQREE